MKFIRYVRPVCEETRKGLEKDLIREKERFLSEGKKALDVVREDLDLSLWAEKYPIQMAFAVAALGLLAGQAIVVLTTPDVAEPLKPESSSRDEAGRAYRSA